MNGRSGYYSAMQNFSAGLRHRSWSSSVLVTACGAARSRHSNRHGASRPLRRSAVAVSVIAALRAERSQVIEEARFEAMHVFILAASSGREREPLARLLPELALRPVNSSSMRVTANQDGERVSRMFDGDLDTRWFSDGHQSGQEVVQITFDGPRDIARLRFRTSERSTGDYARDAGGECRRGRSDTAAVSREHRASARGRHRARPRECPDRHLAPDQYERGHHSPAARSHAHLAMVHR